jgi:hypothetical protein
MYSAARIDMFFPMEFQGKSPKMADVYLETSMNYGDSTKTYKN